MDQKTTALIEQYQSAMINRDIGAVRRIAREMYRLIHPNEPINITKIDRATRHYSREVYGWDMP